MFRRADYLATSTLLVAVIGVALAGHQDILHKCAAKTLRWTGGSGIDWPCSDTKSLYKSTGKYVARNVIATRAAIYKDNVFLALPRYRTGVPITLAKLGTKGKSCQPSISPFPSWTLQEEGNCAALQSVVDVFLDPHGVLWALDTGIVDSLEEPVRKCPPKVVAINAKSGKVVKNVDLSPLTNDISGLQYVVVDYAKNGHVFVYVSDATNRAILVHDVTSVRGYRVILPKAVTDGCTRRDVLYMSLIRKTDGGGNSLVFTYLGSKNLFAIKSANLQSGSAHGKIRNVGPKRDKVVFLGTDNASGLFFRNEGESDIYKWNLNDGRNADGVVKVYQGDSCALPTQVLPDCKRGKTRVLESNFPDYFQGTVGCGVEHALKSF